MTPRRYCLITAHSFLTLAVTPRDLRARCNCLPPLDKRPDRLALPPRDRTRLVRPRRADLRRAHRLGHAEEDRHTLTTAAGRDRFCGAGKAAIDVLPVVHHPHVPGRSDREIGLHLEPAAHVPAGRRDLVAGLEAGRTVLGAHT